jgi:hypothetical protein
VLEQIPPLRGNFSKTALRIPLGIRAGPVYQLGDGLIVEIESVSDAFTRECRVLGYFLAARDVRS